MGDLQCPMCGWVSDLHCSSLPCNHYTTIALRTCIGVCHVLYEHVISNSSASLWIVLIHVQHHHPPHRCACAIDAACVFQPRHKRQCGGGARERAQQQRGAIGGVCGAGADTRYNGTSCRGNASWPTCQPPQSTTTNHLNPLSSLVYILPPQVFVNVSLPSPLTLNASTQVQLRNTVRQRPVTLPMVVTLAVRRCSASTATDAAALGQAGDLLNFGAASTVCFFKGVGCLSFVRDFFSCSSSSPCLCTSSIQLSLSLCLSHTHTHTHTHTLSHTQLSSALTRQGSQFDALVRSVLPLDSQLQAAGFCGVAGYGATAEQALADALVQVLCLWLRWCLCVVEMVFVCG